MYDEVFIPIEIISLSLCFFLDPTFEEKEVVDSLFWYYNKIRET